MELSSVKPVSLQNSNESGDIKKGVFAEIKLFAFSKYYQYYHDYYY